MTIRFRCPHCKKPLGVKDHLAGKKAACPACKKGMVIPAAPAASAKAAAKPVPATPEPPPPDVDELAAAALNEQPEANGTAEEAPATIDFKCDSCETEIHAPRTEAGKRMQCPNPECRQLLKVPVPKEKPKDWRDLARKGPTVAQMTQPDKIDEAAWGTQTDKTRAGSESLKKAGAIVVPPKRRIGVRDWIQRGMIATGVLAALVVAVLVLSRARTVTQEKDFVRSLLPWVEGKGQADESIGNPVVRAEVYRAIGEYKVRRGKKNSEVLDALQKALASARQPARGSAVEHDLFLGALALTITELGGTEQDEIAKEKYDWKGGTIRKELLSTLEAIGAPEARVMAMRTLTTRLLELEQAELAVGLASQLSNPEKGRRPPVTAQLVTLLLLKDRKVDNLVRVPDPTKELPEPLARIGFAEYHARQGNFAEAKALAIDVKGPAIDQLAACVGVAQVILGQTKDAHPEQAAPFVERALEIASGKTRVPPWLLLQTIRVVARVKGAAAVPPAWLKELPPEFAARGTLEVLQADLDAASAALPTSSLADLKEVTGDSPALDFGWEALARQNARVGRTADVQEEATYPDNHRFFPMVRIGITLGGAERR